MLKAVQNTIMTDLNHTFFLHQVNLKIRYFFIKPIRLNTFFHVYHEVRYHMTSESASIKIITNETVESKLRIKS